MPNRTNSILLVRMAQVSFWAIPGYSVLPTVTEAVIEAGWTRAYARVADVGLPRYLLYFWVYMACVEFGVYWMHRLLHDIRAGYKCAPEPKP
jgi:Delta7-sterol 5-desaturase